MLFLDVLPFGRLWYGEPSAVSNAIGFARFFSRSHDAVIRVYDEAGNVIEESSKRASSKSRNNRLELSGERINHGVYGFSCTFDHTVPDILGCHNSALRDVSCRFDGSCPNRANRDREGENDRKECFHGTKVFVADRSRAFTRLSSRLRGGSQIRVPQKLLTFHPHAQ